MTDRFLDGAHDLRKHTLYALHRSSICAGGAEKETRHGLCYDGDGYLKKQCKFSDEHERDEGGLTAYE